MFRKNNILVAVDNITAKNLCSHRHKVVVLVYKNVQHFVMKVLLIVIHMHCSNEVLIILQAGHLTLRCPISFALFRLT